MAFRNKKNKKSSASNIPSMDLHGAKEADVYDRLEKFVSQQANKGTPIIHIITGKGTGKVKAEAQRYLSDAGYSWRHDGNNTGVLVVAMN